MRKNRIFPLMLAAVLSATTMLAGCGNSNTQTSSGEQEAATGDSAAGSDADNAAEGSTGSAPQVSHDKELTLEFYDKAANYQGIQSGWYGKELKDELNIVLNIIAPQVSGDANSLYQTRSAAGNLGDIIIIDNAEMQDCIDAGLIMDIGDIIGNYPNLMKYSEQINAFNDSLEGVESGSIFAIPCNMNSNGPTEFLGDTVYSAPRVPWDYFQELGEPEMKDTKDLLEMLAQMQAAHPVNEKGDKAYAISLWPDWDKNSIETVNQLTKWYGQEVKESVLLGTDHSIMPLTDKDGAYYRMLHFLYEANQMGLVDPDSATQDWNAACDKMKEKRVYLFWYNWQRGFWNTPDKGQNRDFYVCAPVEDLNIYQASDAYFGEERAWGIGSQVDEETKLRIMEYLDWLCTPASLTLQHAGQEGLIYTVNDDGTYTLTEDGLNRFTDDVQVPEELGGGLWNDGNNQVNQWIVGSIERNPETGDLFATDMWTSYLAANQTVTTKEWAERYGAVNEVEYFKAKGSLNPVANINVALESDSTDIALVRSQCGTLVCDYSWRMIFAGSDAEFDTMWDDMVSQLEGFGWNDLVSFDTVKYQTITDARKAVE